MIPNVIKLVGKKESIPNKKFDWRSHSLYKGIDDTRLPEAYFIHSFLKDHPNKGENVRTNGGNKMNVQDFGLPKIQKQFYKEIRSS